MAIWRTKFGRCMYCTYVVPVRRGVMQEHRATAGDAAYVSGFGRPFKRLRPRTCKGTGQKPRPSRMGVCSKCYGLYCVAGDGRMYRHFSCKSRPRACSSYFEHLLITQDFFWTGSNGTVRNAFGKPFCFPGEPPTIARLLGKIEQPIWI